MARKQKGHNWKARQQKDVKVDMTEAKKLKIDPAVVERGTYDDSNLLVLPSVKRKTVASETDAECTKKPLTKTQRKKLQQIVERKKKKLQRADLLEQLSKVKATAEEKALLVSTADMQSNRINHEMAPSISACGELPRINAVAGANRRRHHQDVKAGFADSSTDTSDESSDDEMAEAGEDNSQTATNTETGSVESMDTSLTENLQPVDSGGSLSTSDLAGKQPAEATIPEVAVSNPRKPAVYIPLNRTMEMEEQRKQLPIIMEEQIIMEAIHDNPVVIIHGETGSGKTTQVPQFLYEAGYAHDGGIIGVTEPRRVAAVCMARRVAAEMNLPESEVSYQIRYEGNVTDDTRIKFMTDGVLLKELQTDEMLSKYRVIILDEAHERSVYTDVLIGWLSRIQILRNKQGRPLNLVIMSATLRIEDFTENRKLLKEKPPVISITTRKYQVVCRFNKRTDSDYVTTAYKKISKIHRTLPDGGILVFVTGREEVQTLCRKLRRAFPGPISSNDNTSEDRSDVTSRKSSVKEREPQASDKRSENDGIQQSLADFGSESEDEGDIVNSDHDTAASDSDSDSSCGLLASTYQRLHVLPFYSVLPADQQAEVFKPPPENTRLCIVATNVAETSLTIPGIKYVVDTGKVKTKFYDKVTGVSAFKVTWISKASAEQRAGRAGRTGKGDCFRLYSSAVYENHFEKYTAPEITRRPIDDLVLQMKDLGILKVKNFPFPTPPDCEAIDTAEKLLLLLGALKMVKVKSDNPSMVAQQGRRRRNRLKQDAEVAAITQLGRSMARFPIAPRYAKMLSLGHQQKLLPYVITMVTALSVPELFVDPYVASELPDENERLKQMRHHLFKTKQQWAGSGNFHLLGDAMVLLRAISEYEANRRSTDFCTSNGIRPKAMNEILKLRQQLTAKVKVLIPNADVTGDSSARPPTDNQARLLRQILLAGLGDHVARKMHVSTEVSPEEAKKLRHAYQCSSLDEPVYIHPSSVLYHANMEYVVYQTLEETSSKLYMKGVTVIEADWLPVYVLPMCRNAVPVSQTDSSVTPRYNAERGVVVRRVTTSFGRHYWPLPAAELEYEPCQDQLKWFAQFLLEGIVFEKLEQFAKHLLSPPSLMTKQWAHLQPRTTILLNALSSRNAVNRKNLTSVWTSDSQYLLAEYCQWLPESVHSNVRDIWPPL